MNFFRISIILLLSMNFVHASKIKSITGNIIFDSNNDGVSDARLNSDGLAIGTNLNPSAKLHIDGDEIVSGNLTIGNTSGNSSLEVHGSVGYGFETISSNTTLSNNSVIFADTSSDNIDITLPYAGNVTGRKYFIKKTSELNTLTVSGNESIDNANSISMSSGNSGYPSVSLMSNGTQWFIENQNSITINPGISSDNLIVWWKLDESSGTTATDSSGQANDGALTNSPTWTAGKIDNGLDFDGSNDYVIKALSGSSLTELSVSFWYKPESTIATQRGVFQWANGLNAAAPFILIARENNTTDLKLYVDGDYRVDVSSTNGTWHLVTLTLNSSNLWTIYVDGSSAGTYDDGASLGNQGNALNLYLGNGYNGYANGVIDDFRVYTRNLSAAEASQLYQEGQ